MTESSSSATTAASKATAPKTDITIYGATSFVAKHVITYLVQAALMGDAQSPNDDISSNNKNKPLRITLAGRNADKLKALETEWEKKVNLLRTTLSERSDDDDDATGGAVVLDTWTADADDDDALAAMASRTVVVLNAAGPFVRYGSGVVAACALRGADYVDVTGEGAWAAACRRQYGPQAAASGARLVSFCGYDSVPADLAVYAAVRALRERRPHARVTAATAWHAAWGAPNGGTLRTLMDYPLNATRCFRERCRERRVPFLLDDPLVLSDDDDGDGDYDDAWRNVLARTEWWNALTFQFHPCLRGGVSAPFAMAPVNAKVVHASAKALRYNDGGDDDEKSFFTYQERFLPVGFRFTAQLQTFSLIPAVLSHVAVLLGVLLLRLPVLGEFLLQHVLGGPGTGPSDAACAAGHAEVYVEVRTARDDATGRVDKANAFVRFQGDPGNWVTAQCASEAALTLLRTDPRDLPRRSRDGFGTPAQLLGAPLLRRLQNSRVRPVRLVTDVRLQTAATEWKMFP